MRLCFSTALMSPQHIPPSRSIIPKSIVADTELWELSASRLDIFRRRRLKLRMGGSRDTLTWGLVGALRDRQKRSHQADYDQSGHVCVRTEDEVSSEKMCERCDVVDPYQNILPHLSGLRAPNREERRRLQRQRKLEFEYSLIA